MITHDAYHAGEINHLRSLLGPDDRWRFQQLGFRLTERYIPCVPAPAGVYEDVTTHMAIAELDRLAYERAFDAHWSDVFRFALAWTNDWGAAEDLAQDAFLRLWDHRDRLDWDGRSCRGSS